MEMFLRDSNDYKALHLFHALLFGSDDYIVRAWRAENSDDQDIFNKEVQKFEDELAVPLTAEEQAEAEAGAEAVGANETGVGARVHRGQRREGQRRRRATAESPRS